MEIAVKATYAHLVKDESLVQNSDKLYIVEFRFDQSWDGYAKSAVFEAGGVQQPPVALTDDRCIIPAECFKRAGINLKIGVSGKYSKFRCSIRKISSGFSESVPTRSMLSSAPAGSSSFF